MIVGGALPTMAPLWPPWVSWMASPPNSTQSSKQTSAMRVSGSGWVGSCVCVHGGNARVCMREGRCNLLCCAVKKGRKEN
jgi:hypothetical protein